MASRLSVSRATVTAVVDGQEQTFERVSVSVRGNKGVVRRGARAVLQADVVAVHESARYKWAIQLAGDDGEAGVWLVESMTSKCCGRR